METDPSLSEFVAFFKALADANRLKIVGLLANHAYTVEQLAVLLNLGPSTVSHHLARLADAGLVSARADGYYNLYSLDTAALESMSRRLLARENLPALAADVDLDSFDRKVVRDYTLPDGSLKTLPAQQKKLEAILRHILPDFEPGRRYPEKEVNDILRRYHADTASLRRAMIGAGYLQRDQGVYWRP
jgi:predicted transcriptional regulator